MELNIAVVDDDPADAQRLRHFLKVWAEQAPHSLGRVDSYLCGEDMLRNFLPGTLHVVFMDILMHTISGLDTAARLRNLDSNLLIIFLTASREYVFDAFPVHAFDYLIKPCTKKNVERVMNEAAEFLDTCDPKVTLMISHSEYTLPARTISSAVSNGRSVKINLTDGRCLLASMTFREVREALARHDSFLPCNKGIIVNMTHITAMKDGAFIMKDGTSYPIRINGQAQVRQKFSQYLILHMKAVSR
ncbi:MAG: response regulator transcription factor [Synergistaceae bacterium]|nr:response regulator transcription factor [Synergistaceae bacterium]